MAGQRPEWTSLLLRAVEADIILDESPPNNQAPDFVGTLTDLADFSVSYAA